MNEVNLIGRLGQNPETKNGACKFSIATNDGTKEKQKTNWHNIVAFGKTGEVLQKYLSKGDQVGISGRLDYHKHEDKVYTSIIVNSFTFIGAPQTQQAPPLSDEIDDEIDDDLGF